MKTKIGLEIFKKVWQRGWPTLIRWGVYLLLTIITVGLIWSSISWSQRRAAIEWVKRSGGDVYTEPSLVSKRFELFIRPGIPRAWVDNQLGSGWSAPFDRVTGIVLGETMAGEDLRRLRWLPEVSFINLGTDVSEEDMRCLLRWLPNLERLILGYSASDEYLGYLESSTNLRELILGGARVKRPSTPTGPGITDDGLVHLSRFPNLEYVSLGSVGRNTVGDAGLVHLSYLQNLQRLDLSGTRITDKGIIHLSGLTKLERLDLARTRISGEGLVHLKGLTNLGRLELGGTRIPPSDVSALQAALPKCRIDR